MLLVGILVVGIIVYMVYRYMLGPGLTQEDCRSLIVSWCNTCKAAGCFEDPSIANCVNMKYSNVVNSQCNKYFANPPGDCAGGAATTNHCATVGIT